MTIRAYTPAEYGDGCAEFYEELYRSPRPEVVQTLLGLAAGGAVLELGVGTGRVALALVHASASVTGIEASSAMLRILRSKRGAERLNIIHGDFVDTAAEGVYSLVFALVSTFFLLPTRSSQARCLVNVAQHLAPSGRLVLEVTATDGQRLASQPVSHRIHTDRGDRVYTVRLCTATPAELDELAHRAGLRLVNRWKNWRQQPFHPGDDSHISVYGRA